MVVASTTLACKVRVVPTTALPPSPASFAIAAAGPEATVMAMVSLSVSGPPAPLWPWTSVRIASPAGVISRRVEDEAVERGVDGGDRPGEGHRRVVRAVAGAEGQPGGAAQR